MTLRLQVTRLRTYPVKSMAGNEVQSATVEPWGLADDRRWALIDEAGKNVTARMVHSLLGLHAELADDHAGTTGIRITDRTGESITVPTPRGGRTVPVGFSGLDRATLASPEPDAWLTSRCDRPLRLVWQADPTARPISQNHGGLPGESLSLADDGPLLLVTESSMQQLNEWVAADTGAVEPLDIVRFRPNVIVNGDVPFAEDHWARVRIGEVDYRRTVLCDRCVMTTIEPTTLTGGKEPIRTLARHRGWGGKTWFGIRLTPVGVDAGSNRTISVGDGVEVELD